MELVDEYVWATEVNLATLDEMAMLRSSSQRRIERQTSICLTMLMVLKEHRQRIGPAILTKSARVRRILEGGDIAGGLRRVVDEASGKKMSGADFVRAVERAAPSGFDNDEVLERVAEIRTARIAEPSKEDACM